MPNNISIAWLKNVNNLRTNSSKNSDHTTTNSTTPTQPVTKIGSQTVLINQTSNPFYTNQSTGKSSKTNLLNNSFTHYPQYLLICNPNKI